MGLWDSLKNALNIGGNEPVYKTSYDVPTKLDKAKYLAKKGLSSIKDGKSFLFDKIGGFTDKVGDKVENALFGQLMPNKIEATEITQDKDGNTVIESGVGTPSREGGMITDFVTGFKDNFNNKFQPANLMGDDKKGLVQRIGEGLGTVARFAGSPLGRGLLMAGTVGALGGSGGQALAYGLGTTAQNQQLRGADRLYRDSLASQGIDTNNVRGYINNDTYKNIALSTFRNNNLALKSNIANAKDNTQRAKMILKGFNDGTLSEEDAKQLLLQHGISVEELQASNDTRKTDSQILLNTKRGEKLDSDIAINDFVLGSGNPTTGKVKVQAPNGNIYNVDVNRVQEYINAGGKVIK